MDSSVVVPSGRVIRFVNVTAGWTLVEMAILVVVSVRSSVETTLEIKVAVLTCVLVMYSVDAGCTESTVVVPSGRVTRFVNVTAGATLVETM